MINKEKNFISAVVYVNNDEKNIKEFLKNLNKILNDNFLKYEIICVNDCSTDNTVDEIKKVAGNTNTTITIVNMSFYQGKELAMNAGIDIAIGDFVYEFDTTVIDYDINTVIEAYKKALESFDIVNATSNKKRYKSSKLFYKIFNKFSNNQYKIDTDTFRILSRRAINRIHSMNKTIPYRKAIYAICIFLSSNPMEGWTTTMLFLSFGFFGIFAILAIVIKYLSIIVNLIFKKSKYIVESIDKIN